MHAGANKVISPYATGGHRMAQGALCPVVVDIVELVTHYQSLELQLEEIVALGSLTAERKEEQRSMGHDDAMG